MEIHWKLAFPLLSTVPIEFVHFRHLMSVKVHILTASPPWLVPEKGYGCRKVQKMGIVTFVSGDYALVGF